MSAYSTSPIALTLSLVLSPTLPLSGCAPLPSNSDSQNAVNEQQPVDAELLVNSLQCGEDIQEAGVHWISDVATLDDRYRQLNRLNPERQLSPPRVDFATERLLVVAMGHRPTSGYLLNLPDQLPRTDGSTLDVIVAWQEPEADTVQAQVQVNPCLLIRLATAEEKPVRVLDRDGQVKIDVDS